MGQKLGKHALVEIATIVKPDTMLGWHRKCVAQKCDGSTQRTAPGRPMTDHEVEALVVRMAREHRSWGYDRLVGPLANLGDTVRAPDRGHYPQAPWHGTSARAQDHHLEGVHPHASGGGCDQSQRSGSRG
jgi:hypothetical protein